MPLFALPRKSAASGKTESLNHGEFCGDLSIVGSEAASWLHMDRSAVGPAVHKVENDRVLLPIARMLRRVLGVPTAETNQH